MSLLLRSEMKPCPLPSIIRISVSKVNFGYQSLFLKISLEKRCRLIIRLLYSGQYGSYKLLFLQPD